MEESLFSNNNNLINKFEMFYKKHFFIEQNTVIRVLKQINVLKFKNQNAKVFFSQFEIQKLKLKLGVIIYNKLHFKGYGN